MQQPTVLCVENADSGFLVSKEILQSGSFRLISVTTGDAALEAFSAVEADAAVLDCRSMADEVASVAARMREMNSSVPQFLIAPVNDAVNLVDTSSLTYIVHDIAILSSQLKTLLAQTNLEQRRQADLLKDFRTNRGCCRMLSSEIHAKVESLHNSLDFTRPAPSSRTETAGFQHIRVSVCKRCRQVVAMTDTFSELQADEASHQCKG